MRNNRSTGQAGTTRVVVVTADAEFERAARETFPPPAEIELTVLSGPLAANEERVDPEATVAVVDLDTTSLQDLAALQRLTARLSGRPPGVAGIPSFDQETGRPVLQTR